MIQYYNVDIRRLINDTFVIARGFHGGDNGYITIRVYGDIVREQQN